MSPLSQAPDPSGECRSELRPEERLALAVELTKRAKSCAADPHRYKQAADLLEEAWRVAPDDPTVRQNYVSFCTEVGTSNLHDGNFDEAASYFERALHVAPNDPETWLDLGTARANQDKALDAIIAWKNALNYLDERNPEHRENIQAIAENVVLVARALTVQVTVMDEKSTIARAISKILTDLRRPS
jgi:tetratricopeptide (TPR) repeat protein